MVKYEMWMLEVARVWRVGGSVLGEGVRCVSKRR